MMCDRYWRDGILLVERGEADPHRDGCADCARAHAARQELIDVLPQIGAGRTGDAHWQAKVWRRIDGERAGTAARWRWFGGALIVACAIALWIGLSRQDLGPGFEIIHGTVAMRSEGAHYEEARIDDRLRVTVDETFEVWIYRSERLQLWCSAGKSEERCTRDSGRPVAEMTLDVAGTYHVIIVKAPVAPPGGDFDEDHASLESARAKYELRLLRVR
jgi:hypothetical protein